ncbi:hypothetical protein ACIA98_33305 [Streptomyces sp. NPDC051366]|uniref:hypothetical protein n=1 Tax=Streptomyces sp. NPDC051366 TaxID=3365652 RepID=UPI003799523E
MPDPLWQRLISVEHFEQETESTLRRLRLAADPTEEITVYGEAEPERCRSRR